MKSASLLALLPCASMAGNFSVAAVAGYGLPLPGAYIGENISADSRSTATERSYEAVYGSYADGMRIGGEIGYAMSENVSLALGIRYEASSEYEFTNESRSTTTSSIQKRTRSVSGVAFIPSIVYSLPGEVYRPYMRVNGHFGMPTEIVKGDESRTTGTAGVPTETSYEYERTGGIAWGFGGGLGVEYVMSPAVSILFEVVSESWTWGAAEQELTKLTVNGEDMLDGLDENRIKTKYKDSFTEVGNPDPDSPDNALQTLEANSAISMNIGLKLRF